MHPRCFQSRRLTDIVFNPNFRFWEKPAGSAAARLFVVYYWLATGVAVGFNGVPSAGI